MQNLEASTAMTSLREDVINKAGGEAARLVKAAVSSKTSKSGRKGKSLAPFVDAPEPARNSGETHDASAVTENGAFQVPVISDVDPFPLVGPQAEPVTEPLVTTAASPGPEVFEQRTENDPEEMIAPLRTSFPEGPADSVGAPISIETESMTGSHEPVLATALVEGGETSSGGVTRDAVTLLESTSRDVIVQTDAPVEDFATVAKLVPDALGDGEDVITPLASGATATGAASSDGADLMRELGDRVARRIQGNIDSSIDFWISMMQVRSPSEALEVNARHLRQQMKSFVSQCEDLGGLADSPWLYPWRLWTGTGTDPR